MVRILQLAVAGTPMLLAGAVLSATPPTRVQERAAAVAAFIEDMSARHAFDREELERAFRQIRSRPKIVELMDRAAKPKPWEDYRALFVNPEKLTAGARFWSEHEATLERASERYGVPAEIITAILGIETHFGKQTGGFQVLEALATLAFEYPRRAEMFRTELEHFLLLAREESLSLVAPRGSYAGAMGIAQFMPGSYRRYAVDFDGDGKRDLFSNPDDAIGSVANYLTAHGWKRGEPIAVPAIVAEGASETFRTAELTTRHALGELRSLGVQAAGAFEESLAAIPLTLRTRDGSEHWLGFENFYVITRYNRSVFYAMAVHQLAEALRDQRSPGLPANGR